MPEPLQYSTELIWLCCLVLDLGFSLLMYRFFGLRGLYGVVVLSILMANLHGPKLTIVFGLQTSLGVIIYSGIYFATDLIGEKYGRREAGKAVLVGFAASIMLLLITSLGLLFPPSDKPETAMFSAEVHEAMRVLFQYTPRFVIGSLLAYLISQSFDVWVYHFIRRYTGEKHLWLRNNGSTMMSQALDTFVYSVLVWWGTVSLSTALMLGLAKYFFKVLIALMDTPFLYLAKNMQPQGDQTVKGAPVSQNSSL